MIPFDEAVGTAQETSVCQTMRLRGRNVKKSDVILDQMCILRDAKKWLGKGIVKLILTGDDDGSLRSIILDKLKENQLLVGKGRGRIDFGDVIDIIEKVIRNLQ